MVDYSKWPNNFLAKPREHLSTNEAYQIQNNVSDMDKLFARKRGTCGAPGCSYPLMDDNYRLVEFGDVCRLCHDMHTVVNDRMYWIELHREWKNKQK